MEMQIIENNKLKEKLYIGKLNNGLTVMIIPKKNIQKKYVMWATNYGSIDNEFIVPGETEKTTVPDGIAHFLEHKLFEQEGGTNSLDTLTAMGVNANAYTTNNHTAYLFECTDSFYPALDEFMNYVQHPYFTDENVEKEKGIIGQEIMMYDDYPEWQVYMNAIKDMYKNNPVNLDIAGTIKSISKIEKEVLYKCYSTFYNPSNMVICFSGDFEPEELMEEIKKRLVPIEAPQGSIERIYPEEPEEIVKKETEVKMEVSIPMFVIGIKDNHSQTDIVTKHIAIEILLNILIGKSSNLYKRLYEEELIMSEPDLEYEFAKSYAHITITGGSKEPKKILEEFKKEIQTVKENGINEQNFKRIKNTVYGEYVKEFNNVSDISRMFVSDYFKGINSFDYIDRSDVITLGDVTSVLNTVFNEDKIVLSIVKGK